jgi:hypothetical protein
MPDYQQGKIYMVESLEGNIRYYGSTCQPLFKRMCAHRSHYKAYKDGKFCYVSCFEVLKHSDAKMVWVADCPSNSKAELDAHEARYIRENVCVNKRTPGAYAAAGGIAEYKAEQYQANKERFAEYYQANKDRVAEYYQANRGRITERAADYYQANKERIAERKAEYYQSNRSRLNEKHTCECGGMYTIVNKARHPKSKRHISWANTQPPEYASE